MDIDNTVKKQFTMTPRYYSWTMYKYRVKSIANEIRHAFGSRSTSQLDPTW